MTEAEIRALALYVEGLPGGRPMTIAPRHWAILAACAGLAMFIAANWQFVRLAFDTAPGCVPVDVARPAAKPAC